MPKKKKERRVDYDQREMIVKSKMKSREKFTYTLKRICDMYDINILDFKVDEKNKNSGFFLTPECAELLALLIRHHADNPLARVNPDLSKIKATEVGIYNGLMIEDIDDNVHKAFRRLIYTKPAHLVSQEIADWSEPLVRQFTYFLINIATLGHENVGAALKEFTKKLDDMNYCLFRGNYVIQKAIDTNYPKHPEGYKQAEFSEILDKQNISIDKLVATMIKCFCIDAKSIRERDFPDLEDILEEENQLYKLIGMKKSLIDREGKELFTDIQDLSDDALREAYFVLTMKPELIEATFRNNVSVN